MSSSTEFLGTNAAMVMFLLAIANQFDVPFPFEVLLLSAGAMLAQHTIDPLQATVAPILGAILGNLILYVTGRRWGPSFLQFLSRVTLDLPPRGEKIERHIDRWGARYLLVSNFLPLSCVAAALCGMRNIPQSRVLPLSTLGIVGWVAAYETAGYAGGTQLGPLMGFAGRFLDPILRLSIVAAVGMVVAKLSWHWRVLRLVRRGLLSPERLKAKLDTGERPVILDVRSAQAMRKDPYIIPGACVLPEGEIEERRNEIPTDRDLIVYGSFSHEIARARIALRLDRKHLERIHGLEGGIEAWRALNYPVAALVPRTAVRSDEQPRSVSAATIGKEGAL